MLSLAVKRERYRFMAGVRRQVRERWGTRDVVPIRDDEDKRGRKEAERVFLDRWIDEAFKHSG